MSLFHRFYGWVCEDDWRGFAVLVLAQVVFVLTFLWFAHWISDYARLNWY